MYKNEMQILMDQIRQRLRLDIMSLELFRNEAELSFHSLNSSNSWNLINPCSQKISYVTIENFLNYNY